MIGARSYDHAIVLSYRNELSAEQADARTMLMLLTLHKARASGAVAARVVAEMRDRANVAIARTIEVDDFIVSDELSSLMLAQVSERRELDAVFRDLFEPSGCVLTLRPAPMYVGPDETAWAATVVGGSAAWRERDRLPPRRFGDRGQPGQDEPVALGPDDRVLVLAHAHSPRPGRAAPAIRRSAARRDRRRPAASPRAACRRRWPRRGC